ncbi:YrhB domain-containing protein [Streptomyces sp. NPDC051051]|uniref:YrhB domain-containing protein n=1 Tax=Streptomyces sp. NPDC051051 TaxID=3155666 RepID=UPI00343ACCCD
MLDIEEATELAKKFLDEKVSHEGMTLALVEGERTQVGSTFYFDCQSVAYLRTGDLRDMAVGTGYVRVDGETGECRMLGATESAQLDLF